MSKSLTFLVTRAWQLLVSTSSRQRLRKCLVPDKVTGVNSVTVTYRVVRRSEPLRRFDSKTTAKDYIRKVIGQFYRAIFATTSVVSGRRRRMDPARAEKATMVAPPEAVRGMTTLDRKLFMRTVPIPCLKVPLANIGAASKVLKADLFKLQRVKPVAELSVDDPCYKTHKLFLLNPQRFQSSKDFSEEDVKSLNKAGVEVSDMSFFDLDLQYENWPAADILRAVLPPETDGVTSYSLIGHIAHLNLKPEVMSYKHLIGEVILDKTSTVRTVVNKLTTIDNTFRNFQMELLAGEDNYLTTARENGCSFEMDFAKVYWNPRLSTEHMRVVDLLRPGDLLLDVFAGVGPFAIPAARKGVRVHANDLNPYSHSALLRNAQLNKVKAGLLEAYNLDGREFIKTVVRRELAAWLHPSTACLSPGEEAQAEGDGDEADTRTEVGDPAGPSGRVFITMNLPALALDFLDAFRGLLSPLPGRDATARALRLSAPTALCYCFSKSQEPETDVRQRAEEVLGQALPTQAAVRSVRNVAPNKEMMVLVLPLTVPLLLHADSILNPLAQDSGLDLQDPENSECPAKRQRLAS